MSDPVKYIYEFLPRNFNKTTDEHIKKVIDKKCCYIEVLEIKNMESNWEGSAINSYSQKEPLYRKRNY